jgi:hypothetical protein
MTNYRAISLLPPIAKIFEKLIQQQVLKNSDLLLVKLRAYGFDANSLRLFANYFKNRKQMVR